MQPAPRGWRQTGLFPESYAKRALIGEADAGGNRGHTQIAVAEQRFSCIDPLTAQPGMRRNSHRLFERKCKVSGRQTGGTRNFGKGYVVAQAADHVLTGSTKDR